LLRSTLAAAALAALMAALPSHADFTPVLDGKKLKRVVLKEDAARGFLAADPTPAQVTGCKPTAECGRLDFVYKPARGVTSDLGVSVHWFYPVASDVDLYLLQGRKVVASCASMTGNTRRFVVPRKALRLGGRYTAVMFYSHSFGEKSNMVVSLPAEPVPAPEVPPNLDNTQIVSCSTP
jgi:hypothetical protein